jgi:CelD/BcsL family acetyltransferase involved in cellulose biosynthesis
MGDPARSLRPQRVPDQAFEVVVEAHAGALQQYIPEWESLAANAIESNPFYEHWMLIPAMRELADKDVRVLLIYGASDKKLNGVFPIVWRRSYRRLPIPNISFWNHKYCFLCTPLLRLGCASGTLRAFVEWAKQKSAAWSLLQFNQTNGDGPFADTLRATLNLLGTDEYETESCLRAMIRPALTANSYLETNISNGRRKEWRRQFNRLMEQGPVEFLELSRDGDIETWIKAFMDLEASGWKGRAGSAMLLDQASQRFFSDTMREAFRRRRLTMLMLRVGDIPVAMKCNIQAGTGAFAFKIAYLEEFSRFSPGLQLELETIRRLHENRSVQWMDSCATPNHTMIDHLWAERRTIQTVTLPAPGRFAAPIRSLINFRNRYAQTFGELRKKVKHVA